MGMDTALRLCHKGGTMDWLTRFHQQYPSRRQILKVRGRSFHILLPNSLEPFLDPVPPARGFPLWAKVWDASLVLADHLAGMPVSSSRRVLEIGCGLGVAGVVAAAFGHRVTLSERDPHALRFAKAIAQLNDCAPAGFLAMDWEHPPLRQRFDLIVGSEVIYREEIVPAVVNLCRHALSPQGQVILAEEVRRTSVAFFRQAGTHFELRAVRKTLRSADRQTPVILGSLQPKPLLWSLTEPR